MTTMSSETDRLLVRQIRQGDSRAWEQLISRYEGRLLAFAIQRLRDRTSAEDIVQETFIGFLHSLANFDEKRELQTAIEYARRATRAGPLLEEAHRDLIRLLSSASK